MAHLSRSMSGTQSLNVARQHSSGLSRSPSCSTLRVHSLNAASVARDAKKASACVGSEPCTAQGSITGSWLKLRSWLHSKLAVAGFLGEGQSSSGIFSCMRQRRKQR
eukprot:184426-Chlamydomonas_euryale.AAC.1